LATVGAIDTGSITLKRWGLLGSLTCPGGADGCDKVLGSAWGTVLGQPLSLFGFLAYLAMLLLALLPLVLRGETRNRLASISGWGLLLISTGMAAFKLVFRVVLVALVVGLAGLGWAAAVDRPAGETGGRGVPPVVTTVSTPEAIALAEHLSRSGVVMYSAWWCPHCNDQKKLFGKEATARLTIVECAADGRDSQTERCAAKGIQGFPSWEIKGKLDSGVKSLQDLAERSGFKP
jgi:hypothetical protein